MKKLVSLIALASMLVAGSAFALLDDATNSLGVYFDPAGDTNCIDAVASVPFNMYFILANCSQVTMGGFEFRWRLDPAPVPAPFILGATLPPNALNLGDNSNFIVGLGTPLVTTEATVLVTLQMLLLAPVPQTFIQVGPAQPASLEGFAAFNDGADPALILPMAFSTVNGEDNIVDAQGFTIPGVATLGCEGPVATESETWGGVKALFN